MVSETDIVAALPDRAARELWWHRFDRGGHKVPDAGAKLGIDEALSLAGLDFEVELRKIASPNRKGNWIVDQARRGVVRCDSDRLLGVVGKRYRPVQHREALSFIDEITTGFDARVDCVWGSSDGARIRAAVKYKHDVDIAGADQARPYLLFSTSHDGRGSVKMDVQAVQLSCLNQLPGLVRRADWRWTVHHSTSAKEKLRAAAEAVAQADSHMEALAAELAALASEPIADREAEAVVGRCVRRAVKSESVQERDQAGVMRLLRESPTMPERFRGSRMGVLHAATEYYDFVRPYRTAEAAERSHGTGVAARVRRLALAELQA